VPFPRHRGIPRHLRKFRGAACYSAARGKPWALLITLPSSPKMCAMLVSYSSSGMTQQTVCAHTVMTSCCVTSTLCCVAHWL